MALEFIHILASFVTILFQFFFHGTDGGSSSPLVVFVIGKIRRIHEKMTVDPLHLSSLDLKGKEMKELNI
jgi:hypothetical protein